jgi:hypothetical protein
VEEMRKAMQISVAAALAKQTAIFQKQLDEVQQKHKDSARGTPGSARVTRSGNKSSAKREDSKLDNESLTSSRKQLGYSFDQKSKKKKDRNDSDNSDSEIESPAKSRSKIQPSPVVFGNPGTTNVLIKQEKSNSCNDIGKSQSRFLTSIVDHPNFSKLFNENLENFEPRVIGPNSRANHPEEKTLMMIAEELRISHSGMNKPDFVSGCAYIATRDVLETADPELWKKYHDDDDLTPKMLPHHWQASNSKSTKAFRQGSKSTDKKSRTKRRKTSGTTGSA